MKRGSPFSLTGFWLSRLTWRHARRSWRETIVLIGLLALGVATYLSILMASRSASRGFADFTGMLSGGSELTLQPVAGYFSIHWLPDLRKALGDEPAILLPVLETTAVRPATPGEPDYGRAVHRLLGLDLLAVTNLPGQEGEGAWNWLDPQANWWEWLRDPGTLFVSSDLLREWQVGLGDTVHLLVQDDIHAGRIRGVLPEFGEQPLERTIVMDLPALQRWADRPASLDRVEVWVPAGPTSKERLAEVGRRLEQAAADRWVLATPETSREQGEKITASFRFNLQILALIALLVGIYLIGQAMDAAVVRRRQEIGILRSLGLSRRDLLRLWLLESAVLGLLGGVAGILLGWLLAQFTVQAVALTVNALYLSTAARSASLTWPDIGIGFVLSFGGSLLAGWLPARDAAATSPASTLRQQTPTLGSEFLDHPRLGLGLLTLAVCGALTPAWRVEGGSAIPVGGYVAALAGLLGGTLWLGRWFPLITRLTRCWTGTGAVLLFAFTRLRRAGSRHRLAAAGIMVAVAMAGAMSLLVNSFDRTMTGWIDVRFQADVYLSSGGMQSAGSRHLIRPQTLQALAENPSVAVSDPFHLQPIVWQGRSTFLGASDLSLLGDRQRMLWREPLLPLETIPGEVEAWAIVNESFSRRFAVARGETIVLPTPQGPKHLFIRGIQADYGNEQGLLWIDRQYFREWLGVDAALNVSLFLRPGVSVEEVLGRLREDFPGLQIRGQAALREVVLGIFRQTFALTHALKIIALGVALAGLILGLVSILRESLRERLILRQLGCTRAQMAQAAAIEGIGIALAGLLWGLLLSVGLGWILVYVINRQSFGWTLQWSWPWMDWALLSALLLLAAWLASWAVGRWGTRLSVERTE